MFDLKKYLSNNPLLNEIKVKAPNTFSQDDIEFLNILADESYGESVSVIDIYEPLSETYDLEDFEYTPEEDDYDSKKHIAIKHFLKNFSSGIYILPDTNSNLFGREWEAPGAPANNAYYTRVTIDQDNQLVQIETPYIDDDGEYYVGWFDSDTNYHPDTANFTEDGEYTGNAE
jgi:hypothetical protein